MKYQNRFLASDIAVQFSNGSVSITSSLVNKMIESFLDSKSNFLWNEKVSKKKSILGSNKIRSPFYKFLK